MHLKKTNAPWTRKDPDGLPSDEFAQGFCERNSIVLRKGSNKAVKRNDAVTQANLDSCYDLLDKEVRILTEK